jgi:hypothetical protein
MNARTRNGARGSYASNATEMSFATWAHWEIVRYLDSENPGRNGYFTAEDAK